MNTPGMELFSDKAFSALGEIPQINYFSSISKESPSSFDRLSETTASLNTLDFQELS